MNIEAKVHAASVKSGIAVVGIRCKKVTKTVCRHMVDFSDTLGIDSLKIEISMRMGKIDERDVRRVNGMRVYSVEKLIDQKIRAAEERAKIRDLFDLNYLLQSRGKRFSQAQLTKLRELFGNPAVTIARYAPDHKYDILLHKINLEDLALECCLKLEEIHAP
jgi:hypothetical protein